MTRKRKVVRKKYKLGTNKGGLVRNYIQDPSTAMANNQIMQAQADYASMSNPLTQGMDILGGAAMNYGMGQMSGGIKDLQNKKFAMGGQVQGQVPVEVEVIKEVEVDQTLIASYNKDLTEDKIKKWIEKIRGGKKITSEFSIALKSCKRKE